MIKVVRFQFIACIMYIVGMYNVMCYDRLLFVIFSLYLHLVFKVIQPDFQIYKFETNRELFPFII